MNGRHTYAHTEASRSKLKLRLEFWLHKLTLLSVFLNGEPGNFPLTLVHVQLFFPSRGDETLPAREALFPLSLLSRTDNWAQITVLSGSSAHSLASPPLSASRVVTEQVSCNFHVIYHLKQTLNSAECARWWINRLFLESWKMRTFFLLCQAVETS